jgi:hypothetical protein
MSHNRPAARAGSRSAGSRYGSVEVHTIWDCGSARTPASSWSRSGWSKHFHGWGVIFGASQAMSSGSVNP